MSENRPSVHKDAWRKIRFVPKTKANEFARIEAQVLLTEESGDEKYHDIALTLDSIEGFLKLANLPPDNRHKLLDSLALFPIKNSWILKKKKPKGPKAHPITQQIGVTNRWLAPALLPHTVANEKLNTPTYKKVLRHMKKAGVKRTDSWAAVAFLCERNWENLKKKIPIPFLPAKLPSTFSKYPAQFFQTLGRREPALMRYFDAIRTGKEVIERNIICVKNSTARVTSEKMRGAGWKVTKSSERKHKQDRIVLTCSRQISVSVSKKYPYLLMPRGKTYILGKPWNDFVSGLLDGSEALLFDAPGIPDLILHPTTKARIVLPPGVRMTDFRL